MYISLFAAVIAVFSGSFRPSRCRLHRFRLPCNLWRWGCARRRFGGETRFLSIFLFVLLVAAGVPLLAGGRGGLAVLFTGRAEGTSWDIQSERLSSNAGGKVLGQAKVFEICFSFKSLAELLSVHFFGIVTFRISPKPRCWRQPCLRLSFCPATR